MDAVKIYFTHPRNSTIMYWQVYVNNLPEFFGLQKETFMYSVFECPLTALVCRAIATPSANGKCKNGDE